MAQHDTDCEIQGMIFSAGLGTRFKPWTDHHPKALAIVNGKSLLQRNVEYLREYGVTNVIVNVHHFANQIIDAVKENNGWGSNIIISDEKDEVLETGGGLLKARHLFSKGKKFITCNADILTDLDISKLLAFHKKENALISFGVSERKSSRYLLLDSDGRLCGWRNAVTSEEKIVIQGRELVDKAYSCVVVLDYQVFDLIPFTGKFSLIDVYLHLAPQHKIMGYDHTGDRFVDVGKPGSVETAEQVFP